MNEREFWTRVRRGLLTVALAIEDAKMDDPMWREMRDGFLKTTKAIEYRYGFPAHSRAILGQPGPTQEPPAMPLAQSHTEGIG
jgi:hypothetical protein